MDISAARPREVAEARSLLQATEAVPPADLLVARDGTRVRSAILAQRLPGALGLLKLPSDPDDVADALIHAAIQHLRGVKVIQAFLASNDAPGVQALVRSGFHHTTRVLQLQRDAGPRPASIPEITQTVRLIPFEQVPEATALLERCHQDSLDCPELDRLRTPDEMLEGYRGCAPDPSRWWVSIRGAEAVGILILSLGTVVFLGVVPEHRRGGVGRCLLHHACASHDEISLVVDARNRPALQLYNSYGFRVAATHEVYLYFPPFPADKIATRVSRL